MILVFEIKHIKTDRMEPDVLTLTGRPLEGGGSPCRSHSEEDEATGSWTKASQREEVGPQLLRNTL